MYVEWGGGTWFSSASAFKGIPRSKSTVINHSFSTSLLHIATMAESYADRALEIMNLSHSKLYISNHRL